MGEASTVLTSVKEGDHLWRVQIAWPNGTVHHFGKFRSERQARKWISAHSWLTEHVVEDTEIRRKPRDRVRRLKSAGDVEAGQAEEDFAPASEQQESD